MWFNNDSFSPKSAIMNVNTFVLTLFLFKKNIHKSTYNPKK